MTDLTPAAAILTAAFGHTPAAHTAAPTAPAVPVEPHSHAGLSETDHAAMVGWAWQDVASGKLSPEDATKLFDDLGMPADQRVMPTDTRTDEQRLIDEHFPAAKPADYQIRYSNPGQPAPPMTKELAEFDSSARVWLVGAEFPRELGNSLITTIEKVAHTTKHMDENQLEQYGVDEFAKLERAYGGEDKLQEKLRAAAVMIDALDQKQPGLKNLLRAKGIGDNALVVAQLIGQAERWHARRKGR